MIKEILMFSFSNWWFLSHDYRSNLMVIHENCILALFTIDNFKNLELLTYVFVLML